MNSAFDVSYEASLYGSSEDAGDKDNDELKIFKPLSCYKSQVIKEALVKSSMKIENYTDVNVNKVQETKSLSISDNDKQLSDISAGKEPNTISACVKDTRVNNENADHLSENNIETNDLMNDINISLRLDQETYELEKYKKNAMIIFNHENFLVGEKRLGTALDVAALEYTFKQFRFDVVTRNDLTKQDLFEELKEFTKRNFNDYGCICVAILTHGQDGGFLRARDTRYNERDVFSCFDALANPSLGAKPIIFLIQACRGSTAAASVPYGRVQNFEFDADIAENKSRPTESDMIIFHSSFFGRASVRVVEEGSWFIQTVCEQMKLHGSTDHLEKLFRRVRRIVALDKEYKDVKQMPAVTTTLLKKLYLKKSYESFKEIDGSNRERVTSRAKTKVKNAELKRLTIIILKYIHRFVIGTLLTLLILHQDGTVSSCILIAFVFLFELIRYMINRAYIALFKQVHHFTMFLVLFNFFFRIYPYYYERQTNIDVYVYLFGCWYCMGLITAPIYVAFMFGMIYVIYKPLALL